MSIFIAQGRYDENALSGMIARPEDRGKATARLIEAAGGRLIAHYLTFGRYDFVVIAESPDAEAVAAAVQAAAEAGGVTDVTTTFAIDMGAALAAFGEAGTPTSVAA